MQIVAPHLTYIIGKMMKGVNLQLNATSSNKRTFIFIFVCLQGMIC